MSGRLDRKFIDGSRSSGASAKPRAGTRSSAVAPALASGLDEPGLAVAMSSEDWARFDALVHEASYRTPTQARAIGEVIAGLIHDGSRANPGPSDWMDWERQKTLRLLRPAN